MRRPTDARVAIVGAGPHGLTVACHLLRADPSLIDDLVVVDPSGAWLASWRRSFRSLEIGHLRSPAVHHPHPDPYALLHHARANGRSHELHGRYQSPGAALFDDFCDEVVTEFGLGDRIVAAAVRRVHLDGGIDMETTCGTLDRLSVRHVVLAHAPRRLALPECARALGPSSGRVGHAAHVDVNDAGPDDRVVVIGGGLTAGHLVCAAARRGALVTLVSRRPLVEREFDTDPGWLGPKEMKRFLDIDCLATRARTAAAARGGGTMPSWMLEQLRALEASKRLQVYCGNVVSVDDDVATVRTGRGATSRLDAIATDRVWFATGTTVSCDDDPLLGPLLADGPAASIVECAPVDEALRLPFASASIQVLGRPATHRLGPTAGNLAGARAGALAVVGEVCGLDAMIELDLAQN
jgi:hypothetical protein